MNRAADLIVSSNRLFCVGARSSYPAIYLGSYLLSLIGEQTFLVDGAGGIGVSGVRPDACGSASGGVTRAAAGADGAAGAAGGTGPATGGVVAMVAA